MAYAMKYLSTTRAGTRRGHNEDRHTIRQYPGGAALLAVADGMGGHAAGEQAAEIAIRGIEGIGPDAEAMEAHLVERICAANQKILERAEADERLRDMGTTLTAAFVRDGMVHWAQVGDSRLYLFRGGEIVQVTEDQTVLALLVGAGEISAEEAMSHPLRHMLLSCLGRRDFEADTGTFELVEDDLLLLSTDGLHDALSEEQIAAALRSTPDLSGRLDALVERALAAGAQDDLTVIAAEAGG